MFKFLRILANCIVKRVANILTWKVKQMIIWISIGIGFRVYKKTKIANPKK